MNFEPHLVGYLPDDLYSDAGSVLDPLSGVGAVGKCQCNKREAAPGRFQQWDSPIAVLHAGRMYQQFQGPAISVHHGVPLATHLLSITARNKMATGIDVVGERDISFMGRMIETARLYSDCSRNEENLKIADDFIRRLVAEKGKPEASPHGGAVLWSGVGAGTVADLLDAFLVHPLNFDFQGDVIASFLRNAAQEEQGLLTHWTVAVLTSGDAGEATFASLPGGIVQAKKRQVRPNRDDGSLLVSGKSARVGSNRDVRHGLSPDLASHVVEADRKEHPDRRQVPEDAFRSAMTSPLLLIYPLRGVERVPAGDGTEERVFRDGLLLPALGLHFPGTKCT